MSTAHYLSTKQRNYVRFLEQRLRAGEDVDKMLGSYEKLTKIADFTPKNAKDINDFNSVGRTWLRSGDGLTNTLMALKI